MKKHYAIRISGLVQGVFFRASAKVVAESMRISGIVRNEPDGSVYVEAEGEEDDLRKFIEWCRHGPPHAIVERSDASEGVVKNYKNFVIAR
jgi:acylphosphatase